MSRLYETSGYYGSGDTPCNVLVYQENDGLCWYAVEGSAIVNAVYSPVELGVNVEQLQDCDCFTWKEPIENLEQLEIAVES